MRATKRVRASKDYTWDSTCGIHFVGQNCAEDHNYTWNISRGIRFGFGTTSTASETTTEASKGGDLPICSAKALPSASPRTSPIHAQQRRCASTKEKKSTLPSPMAYTPPTVAGKIQSAQTFANKNLKSSVDIEGQMLEFLGQKPKTQQNPEAPQKPVAETRSPATAKRKAAVKAAKITKPAHRKPESAPLKATSLPTSPKAKRTPSTLKDDGKKIEKLDARIFSMSENFMGLLPYENPLEPQMSVQLKSYNRRQLLAKRTETDRLEQEKEREDQEDRANARSTYAGLREIFHPSVYSWLELNRAVRQIYHFHRDLSELPDVRNLEADPVIREVSKINRTHTSSSNESDTLSSTSLVHQAPQKQPATLMSRDMRKRLYWKCQHEKLCECLQSFRRVSHDYRASTRDLHYLSQLLSGDLGMNMEIWGLPSLARYFNESMFTARKVLAATKASYFSCGEIVRDFRSSACWHALDAFGPNAKQMEADFISRVHTSNPLTEWIEVGNPINLNAPPIPAFTNPSRLASLGGERFIECWNKAENLFQEIHSLQPYVTGISSIIVRLELGLLELPSTTNREEKLQLYWLEERVALVGRTVQPLDYWRNETVFGASYQRKSTHASALSRSSRLVENLIKSLRELLGEYQRFVLFRQQRIESMDTRVCSISLKFKKELHKLWERKCRNEKRREALISVDNAMWQEKKARFWIDELSKLPRTPNVEQAISEWQVRWEQAKHLSIGATQTSILKATKASSHTYGDKSRRRDRSRNLLSVRDGHEWQPEICAEKSIKPEKDSAIVEHSGHKNTQGGARQESRRDQQLNAARNYRTTELVHGESIPRQVELEAIHELPISDPANLFLKQQSSVSGRRRKRLTAHSTVQSKRRPTSTVSSKNFSNKSSYHSSTSLLNIESPALPDPPEQELSDCLSTDELVEKEIASRSSLIGERTRNDNDIPHKRTDMFREDRESGQLVYKIPDDDLRRDITAYKAGKESYWSHLKYRGPNGRSPSVRYCTNIQQSEDVAPIFTEEDVIGFDMEWNIGGSSIKEQVSVIQIACDATIAVFHLALYKRESIDDLIGPKLRAILESPSILKSGVNIGPDFKRVRKYLGLKFEGCFELSHLHNLVTQSATAGKLSKRLVSLSRQVELHLLLPLRKDGVRTSDWTKRLNYEQVKYAAADAYAGFKLFHELDAKRYKLNPVPPRPDTVDRKLDTSAVNDLQSPIEISVASALETGDISGTSEQSGSSSSTIQNVESDARSGNLEAADAVDSSTAKRSKKRHASASEIDEGSSGTLDADAEDMHSTIASDESSWGWVAYPDLTARLQFLDNEEAVTVATENGETLTAKALQLSSADSWIDDWLQELPEGAKPKSRRRQLQAYYLWHQQSMDVHHIAAVLKSPPLSSNTVISYVLDVIRDEELPFDAARLRDLLPKLHQTWVQRRYWSLLKRLD